MPKPAEIATRVVSILLGVIFSIPPILRILWVIARTKGKALEKKDNVMPQVGNDVGEHGFVQANGLKFHYVSAGSRSNPLMLFLHGFPQCWYTWRHQMNQFKSTHFVVAVDLRGYGETEKPTDVAAYSSANLFRDVSELVKALGYEKCVLVGHDWGAVVAWGVAHNYPEIISHLIVMNAPHPICFKKNMTFGQLMKSWYIFFFQLPFLPEVLMSLGNYAAVRAAFTGPRSGVGLPDRLTKDDLAMYTYSISRPGALTAALNYYRNVWRTPVLRVKTISAPTLFLWGENDHALGLNLTTGTEKYVTKLTFESFPDVSHWINEEVPGVVCEHMSKFLDANQ